MVVVPLVLGGVAVAMARYRLDEIEPTVRRALTQAMVAILVGIVFLALARAVNLTSDTSFGAIVAGGALALMLAPRRARPEPGDPSARVRRPGAPPSGRLGAAPAWTRSPHPEVALQETLGLLARRLRLSYAAIEVYGDE